MLIRQGTQNCVVLPLEQYLYKLCSCKVIKSSDNVMLILGVVQMKVSLKHFCAASSQWSFLSFLTMVIVQLAKHCCALLHIVQHKFEVVHS